MKLNQIIRTSVLGPALVLAGLTSSAPADAGQGNGMTFNCYTSGSTSTCYGSLRAARLSSGSSDRAYFMVYSSGSVYFYARKDDSTYSCSFSSADRENMRAAAISADFNTYFYVTMSGGTCSSTYLKNDSAYQHLERP
ncbi:MAG: hypothetical protein JW940_33810 [Polyangiaceae bacterium]|nr:hypothetical protein [Polyangiaceae bacterium]